MTKKQQIELLNKNNGYELDKMDSIVQFFSSQTIAFDVDQTLVMWDERPLEPGPGKLKFVMPGNGKVVYLKPHEKHIFTLKTYVPRGYKVIVWSAAGVEWVTEVIKVLQLEKNVTLGMSKLAAYYDDLPAEQVFGQHLYFHDNIDGEIWKDISEYMGKYQVSQYGRVRKINKFGDYSVKDIDVSNGGYSIVQLNDGKKNIVELVHRLVGLTFLETIPGKKLINHIDGNKNNNNLYNLEWVNHSENRIKQTKRPKFNTQTGEQNGAAKLKITQVLEIYKRTKSGESTVAISRDYNITHTTVYFIKNKKSWKSITDDYDNNVDKTK